MLGQTPPGVWLPKPMGQAWVMNLCVWPLLEKKAPPARKVTRSERPRLLQDSHKSHPQRASLGQAPSASPRRCCLLVFCSLLSRRRLALFFTDLSNHWPLSSSTSSCSRLSSQLHLPLSSTATCPLSESTRADGCPPTCHLLPLGDLHHSSPVCAPSGHLVFTLLPSRGIFGVGGKKRGIVCILDSFLPWPLVLPLKLSSKARSCMNPTVYLQKLFLWSQFPPFPLRRHLIETTQFPATNVLARVLFKLPPSLL